MSARAVMLSELLAGQLALARDAAFRDLTLDSRSVQPGSLFLACQGRSSHGLAYLDSALARGATGVLWEPVANMAAPSFPANVLGIAVPGLGALAGTLADRFFDSPSAGLDVTGITGTNGKTTCAWLLAQALTAVGRPSGYLGTLGVGLRDQLRSGEFTTADAVTVHRQLAGLRAAGASCVAMEVSSHALDQDRVAGVRFKVAAFTNLTRDHLDYHGDMLRYAAAKDRLFDWPGLEWRVVNIDDEHGMALHRALQSSGRVFATSRANARLTRSDAWLGAPRVRMADQGIELQLESSFGAATLAVPLIGAFNVDNVLTVLACLLALEVPLTEAVRVLASVRAPSGRMEAISAPSGPLVLVDYAHTPDALEKALAAARSHCRAQLHVVFGCGGDRDRGKRPLMGAIAAKLADCIWLTDDNPRTENPAEIATDIQRGIPAAALLHLEHDRTKAIRGAIAGARSGDVVLVAGKGHEDYQIIGTQRRPFSDQAIVRAALGILS